MGKIKRQARKHSNHHDNPSKSRARVTGKSNNQKSPHHARQAIAQIASKASTPSRVKIPFGKHDNVLLVGEGMLQACTLARGPVAWQMTPLHGDGSGFADQEIGDFTFSLSLRLHHDISQMTSTCYDSEETVESKYSGVRKTLRQLQTSDHGEPAATNSRGAAQADASDEHEKEIGWAGFSPSPPDSPTTQEDEVPGRSEGRPTVHILYGIDATRLSSSHKKALRPYSPFTKIVFNFPHVGGLSTDVNRQVRYNQELLVGFFNAAKGLLSSPARPARIALPAENDFTGSEWSDGPQDLESQDLGAVNGQVLVTLFEGEPYTLWNIRDLARHCGLKVVESFRFPWSAYPGYQHARTTGDIMSGKDKSEGEKREGAWRGEERDARCYVLENQAAESDVGQARKKRKHGKDDDSD